MSANLHDAASAAKSLGCHPYTVRRIARAHGLGQRVAGVLVLTDADLAALRGLILAGAGNPNFGRNQGFPAAKKDPRKKRKK